MEKTIILNKTLVFEDLGTVEYGKTYQIQQNYFENNIQKKQNAEKTENRILFVEHPHVYTLGKSGNSANLIVTETFLKKINATFFHTDRGGDITYHGFGQIVCYPILDMDNFNILIRKYVYSLEEVIIRTLKHFNIQAGRIDGAAGVWLKDRPKVEKICAIGVRVSHNITMHGFAFNINTDLKYFDYINPCGFKDKGVTSLQKELHHEIDVNEVKDLLKKYFNEIYSEF